MASLEHYLFDGACAQAQAVLAYLRDNMDDALDGTWNNSLMNWNARLDVGRYENYREQGYIFSVRYERRQLNFAVYEHRNSDRIVVVKFECLTVNTLFATEVWAKMKNKYDTDAHFEYFDIKGCGRYIIESIKDFIQEIQLKQEKKDE